MTQIEIDNRINVLEAAIDQMKNHELFNDLEKTDYIKRYNTELEELYKLNANKIN